MTLVLFDKKTTDCDKRYYNANDVDYFIHNEEMIEIHYKNDTRESLSIEEVELIQVSI
ncbi:MAG: hypothetical protein ACRCX8_08705 [Sarcina sp.]